MCNCHADLIVRDMPGGILRYECSVCGEYMEDHWMDGIMDYDEEDISFFDGLYHEHIDDLSVPPTVEGY